MGKKFFCSLCNYKNQLLKWKYKKRPICEACYLAIQCLNEAIKECLEEIWNNEEIWDNFNLEF